ncbi:hypothetical protein WMY93_005289 [Mugilogobius chulae]|uniref:EGF-like domain-containing protein n=1 Tax=Mugilogobius chulae TaxID=88201 RepID=A0AAW0Q208_9GOBI
MMKQLSTLVLLFYVVLLCPPVQTRSTLSEDSTRDAPLAEQGLERPRVAKRSILSCDTSFDKYCLHGQCMFLVDLEETHCKCDLGYLGSRCEQPQLVKQPMREDELALIIVCVVLLILGLSGALYFFCEWYRKKYHPQQQKRLRDTRDQIA